MQRSGAALDGWEPTDSPPPITRRRGSRPKGEKHNVIREALTSKGLMRKEFPDVETARRYMRVLRKIATEYFDARVEANYANANGKCVAVFRVHPRSEGNPANDH